MEGLEGLKGLTAQDRQNWEKQYASNIQGLDPDQTERLYRNMKFKEKFGNSPQYNMYKNYTPEQRDSLYNGTLIQQPTQESETDSMNRKVGEGFQQGMQYQQQSDSLAQNYMNSPGTFRKELDNFDKVATEVSPYYKRYKGTEYLPFSDDEKLRMMAEYNAAKSSFGEETANANLRRLMQNTASNNQSTWEKYWNGFKGMGAQTAGALISAAGMIKGAIDYVGDEANPDLNPVMDFFDHVIDNNWSRYGNDVMQYGSLFDAQQQYAKETGISSIPVIRTTAEQEGGILDNILSVNTIPELINQQGFTVASMLTSAGLTSISNKAFQGMKGAAMAFNRAGTVANLEKVNATLQSLQQAQQRFNAFVVPSLVGTVEGVTEGLNTKIQFLDDAKNQIGQAQTKAINDKFEQMLSNPEELSRLGYNPQDQKDLERLYNDIFQSYSPQYEEAVNRAEANAAKAGVYNMALNSVINGAANMTLKAGMQTPEVQEALRRSRLGRLFTSGDYRVTQPGTVTPKTSIVKQVLNVAQEPAGEFAEEYLQSVTDAFARGGAEYNLANFIANKYTGDGKNAVDDSMANDLLAAGRAAGDAMVDKETILSGIYGALSSGMGTPTINNRRGPAVRMQDESRLEYGLRRSPITYRNPIFEAIKEQRQQAQDRATTAATLSSWIQDPTNKGRYDGLVGTFNWARQMDEAAGRNDEFEYRNSALGKTINDALMLENLQGTAYYDSFLADATRAANVESNSPEAQQLVQQFRNAPNNRDIQQSDEQILETIKKNANNLLQTISTINEESGKIDKMLGNAADSDTKQALIYGKMSLDNWKERATQLEDEIGQVEISPSTATTVPDNLKPILVKYGTLTKADNALGDYIDQIDELKEDIANIEKRANVASKQDAVALRTKKAKLATLSKEKAALRKQLDGITYDNDSETQPVVEGILNEQDIMALTPEDRATMLNPKNKSKYSQEQQAIIDNVLQSGTAVYEDFSNKVQDAGRINIAQRAYLAQYNSILNDPESFNAFTQRVKQKVADDNAKDKYRYLNNIEDYSQFTKELDKAYDGASVRERAIVRDMLKDNQNYNRYLEDNKALESMFDQLETNDKFTAMSDASKTNVLAAMQYLTDRGVRPDNSEEAINALMTADEDGNSELLSYMNDVNAKLPEGMRAIPNSIEEVITSYKEVVDAHNANQAEVAQVTAPIQPEPTTPAQSAPANPFAGIASATLEEADASKAAVGDTKKAPVKPVEKAPEQNVFGELEKNPNLVGTSITDKFRTNSNDEVADAGQAGLNVIQNASNDVYKRAKILANDILNQLADSEYENADALSQAIMTSANQMEVQVQEGGDEAEMTAALLKQVAAQVRAYKPKPQAEKPSPVTNPQADATTEATRNRGMIGTAEVWRHENSIVGKAYKDYKVDEYLKTGKLNRKTPIMFMVDPAIANSTKEEMGEIYNENDHLPIMAVVEDSNGPISIGEQRYQPIGFMPRTSANTPGAARMEAIRQLALSQEQGQLLKSGDEVVTTNGYIRATPPRHLDKSEPNNSLLQILNNDMDATEREAMNSPESPLVSRQTIYNRQKSRMLSRIKKRGQGTDTHLAYMIPNMKDDNDTEFQLFITTPENARSRMGEPIGDILRAGNPKAILTANSRFSRYAKTMHDFFSRNPIKDIKLKEDGQGGLIPSGPESEAKLAEIGEALGKNLENFLYLPSGWGYQLIPTNSTIDDTTREYSLDLVNGDTVIPLTKVHNGDVSGEDLARAIQNLMIDESGAFRKNGSQPLVKFQVQYSDFEGKENESETAKKNRLSNINDIFDDNILEASKESFNYTIKGVDINSPFKQNGTVTAPTSTTVANPTNATPAKPVNEPAIVATDQTRSGDAIVDSETGAPLEGTPVQVESQVPNVTAQIVNRIVEDSKGLTLSPDGRYYVNSEGKQFARVTSVIAADEDAGERFDPASPWAMPSTNIGTSVDELVRDFFAGEFKDNYPNISETSRTHFIGQLMVLKNTLTSKGLTVIPRDVTVTGTVKVTNADGSQSTIDVAGTLDLLAFDKLGNFYVFDMKTNRSGINDEKRAKYAKQVSLYAKFLQDKYGIKVASLNIIPIGVEYPAPKGFRNATAEYSVGEGTQLIVDGKEFRGANPNLQTVGSVEYTDVNIQQDRLTNEEKELLKTVIPEGSQAESIEESKEPKVDKHTGLSMGKVKSRFAKPAKGGVVKPSSTRFDTLAENIRTAIESRGITAEQFNQLTEEEKKQLIDCAS